MQEFKKQLAIRAATIAAAAVVGFLFAGPAGAAACAKVVAAGGATGCGS